MSDWLQTISRSKRSRQVEALECLTCSCIVLCIGWWQQIHCRSVILHMKHFRCVFESMFTSMLIYSWLVGCADIKKGCALINSLDLWSRGYQPKLGPTHSLCLTKQPSSAGSLVLALRSGTTKCPPTLLSRGTPRQAQWELSLSTIRNNYSTAFHPSTIQNFSTRLSPFDYF